MCVYKELLKELATRIAKVRAMLDLDEDVNNNPGYANKMFDIYLERRLDDFRESFKEAHSELDSAGWEDLIGELQSYHEKEWLVGVLMWDDLFVAMNEVLVDLKEEENA